MEKLSGHHIFKSISVHHFGLLTYFCIALWSLANFLLGFNTHITHFPAHKLHESYTPTCSLLGAYVYV